MVFDENLMLREKPKMENKAQGGASDSSTADTQKKGVEFSDSPKRPKGQKRTPLIQMGTNRRLVKSNLDC